MKFPFSRFRVSGKSMEPTIMGGNFVITKNFGKLRDNDVVVFKKSGLTMIKRLLRKDGNRWTVRGDNVSESADSLDFGAIPENDIIGKVIFPKEPLENYG